MSYEYDLYLSKHRANVQKGFEWLKEHIGHMFEEDILNDTEYTILKHDESKNEPDEYEAYDAYFYGGNRSYFVVEEFNKAWLKHIHRNPHHWQHWILINDDPKNGEQCLVMPTKYVIEMICDWWTFSWQKGDLFEIFNWYEEHKDYIKLHPSTRTLVESILESIRFVLESDVNAAKSV